MKHKATSYILLLITVSLVIAVACNDRNDSIPLTDEMNNQQPVTAPFKFTEQKKLDWPDKTVAVKLQSKKIDFNKLPERPFDSLGFMPLAKAPEEFSLDLDKLPSSRFDYERLPSKPLRFKVSVLEPPRLIKADLHIKPGSHNLVQEFGEPLANKRNITLLEDRNGFIWIGAEEGLYRYDGQNLLLYSQAPAAFAMTEDPLGQIWVSLGNSNGICVINQKARILKRLTRADGLATNSAARLVAADNKIWLINWPDTEKDHFGINIIDENSKTIKWVDQGGSTDNQVTRIYLDLKENIWITSEPKGIEVIDPRKETVKYLNKKSGLLADTILGMFQDEKARIWLTEETDHLDAIDIGKKTITRYYLGSLLGASIIGDDYGNIWVATRNSNAPDGVKIINPERKLLKTVNTSSGLNSNFIRPLLKDKRGQIWIPTWDNGLNLMNRNKGSLLQHEGTVEMYDLRQDSAGKIWIGTSHQGVWMLDTATNVVKVLNLENGLGSDSISSMYAKGGRIFIVTNKGVDVVDQRGQTMEHYGGESLSGYPQLISAAKEDKNKIGILTFTKPGVGLDLLDLETRIIQHVSIDRGLTDPSLTSLIYDRQGKIWLAYHTGGVQMIDPVNKTISYYKDEPGTNEHSNKVIFEDQSGAIWIGSDNGLTIINPGRDSLTRLSAADGLISNRVISLNEYKGHIYVGTMGGISIVTPPSHMNSPWQFRSFGKKEGIVKSGGGFSTDQITQDGKFLWGDKGITSVVIDSTADRQTENFITGIDVFNRPLIFSDGPWSSLSGKDTLWGTNNNNFFIGGKLPSNLLYPNRGPLQFESVSGSYNMPANLSLPYYQNYLQFHFTQAHGNSDDTTWYRYILEGVSKKWSERTFTPVSENYLNLHPGKYTFRVSSLNNGKWTKPATFSFTIRPPWWKTWWAYILFALAFAGIIVVAVRYRSRKLKAENLALEEKIHQRTAELKQSLQELQTTQAQLIQSEKMASLGELTAGIAHEIQNPLNFVNNFSEVNKELLTEMNEEINKGNFEEVKTIAKDVIDNEEKISHHGKRADAIVKGMLQHSRTSSGQKEPTDINALADEYLRLAYHGLRAKDKSFNAKFEVHLDKTIEPINVVPQDIGRVLLNLINNAFYAVDEKKRQLDGTYEPTVTASTKQLGSKVEIKVADNGNGIPQKVLDKIFQPFFTTKPTGVGTGLGLSLSYDIVKAHGGEIKVETKEGDGTVFIIQLPA